MLIGLWHDNAFWETVVEVLVFLIVCQLGLKFLSHFVTDKTVKAQASVKSWLFAAPFLLAACGLPSPGPLVILMFISIFASKTFFRMTGMYHRSWFVWITYLFQAGLAILIHFNLADTFYDMTPMIFAGTIFLIPLARNSFSKMIQYIALSLLAFIFFGWSFMHLGRLMYLPGGIYLMMYIYILAEFGESVSLSVTRICGRHKMFQKISQRFSIEGMVASLFFTLLLAWALRHMLPNRTEPYWVAAGLIATLSGRFGDLAIAVIRRDLDIKDSGVFIIGRDDILARIDKLIFVGPIFFYTILLLQRNF